LELVAVPVTGSVSAPTKSLVDALYLAGRPEKYTYDPIVAIRAIARMSQRRAYTGAR
jgi:hypothetical protein